MAQASVTNTRNNHETDPETGESVTVTQRNNSLVFTGASVFLASKLNDNIGGFIQWTYDNLATTADGTLGGHSGIDNTDIRAANIYSPAGATEPDLIYGVTLNNNPTVQDVWNSTPAFGFPFTSAPLANTPAAATQIDGGLAQQVAGVGGYVFWQKALYARSRSTGPRTGPSRSCARARTPTPMVVWQRSSDGTTRTGASLTPMIGARIR